MLAKISIIAEYFDNSLVNYMLTLSRVMLYAAYFIETTEIGESDNGDVGRCLMTFQELPEETSCFHGYGAVVLKVKAEVAVLLGGRQPPHVRLQKKHSYSISLLCCGTKKIANTMTSDGVLSEHASCGLLAVQKNSSNGKLL
jgi:hypothetical protein